MRPVFVEMVTAKEAGDCAIACLSMWTGKPYAKVVSVCPHGAHDHGMTNRNIVTAGRKLGARFRTHRSFSLLEDSGILTVVPHRRKGDHHAVVMLNGVIFDPTNGRVWPDADLYMQEERYRPGVLLVDE